MLDGKKHSLDYTERALISCNEAACYDFVFISG